MTAKYDAMIYETSTLKKNFSLNIYAKLMFAFCYFANISK